MPCYHPVHGHWGPGGRVYFSGGGWRDRPVSVPCGKCLGCRTSRAQSWALRCQHEASLHAASSFLTLTYSPQQLPSDWSLDVRDFQLFAKRVRKELGPFRFFHCGEYGEENLRPHYHALMFGHDFSFDRKVSRGGEFPLYSSPTLDELWGKGLCVIGNVSFQSAAYVARYALKKRAASDAFYERLDPVTGETWSVKPEYCTMSRRPGIGARWFEKWSSDVFPSDEVVSGGRRHRPPRYYSQLFERSNPDEFDQVKARRVRFLLEHPDLSDPDRLADGEEIARSRIVKRPV